MSVQSDLIATLAADKLVRTSLTELCFTIADSVSQDRHVYSRSRMKGRASRWYVSVVLSFMIVDSVAPD